MSDFLRSVPLALALLLVAAVSLAQDSLQSRIQQANQLIAQSDFATAAELLQQVVKEAPEQSGAWVLLARAHRGTGDYDAALAACRQALDSPQASAAAQEMFFVLVASGDLSAAVDAYRRARHTPGVDLSGLHLNPLLAPLAEDNRFVALFPTPEQFADPFVEGRAVIHDWHGEGPGEEFGWEARNVGDVDGDGVADAVVSAPANQPGGDSAGKVYVYSGRSGELLWKKSGELGNQLGMSVEAAGDVDGDRVPDVVASAPGAGKVYVYAGRTGKLVHTFSAAEDDGPGYGTKAAGVGDLDRDGHAEILVGSPSSPSGGRAYVYSGKSGGRLAALAAEAEGHRFGTTVAGRTEGKVSLLVVGAPGAGAGGRAYVYRGLDPEPAFVIDADASGRQLGGMFASVLGDVDADGTPDVYASDWLDAAKGPWTGRIYVASGKDGSRLLTLGGARAGEGFGIGPARAGDVDADGHDDLVVGSWQDGTAAHSGGKISVHSGKDGSLLATYTGKVPGETLGFDADGMGDVNGDGAIDYLVTSAWSLINGVRSGRTMIISGKIVPQEL